MPDEVLKDAAADGSGDDSGPEEDVTTPVPAGSQKGTASSAAANKKDEFASVSRAAREKAREHAALLEEARFLLAAQAQRLSSSSSSGSGSGSAKLPEAVEAILALEKKTRLAEAGPATALLCVGVVRLCNPAGDGTALAPEAAEGAPAASAGAAAAAAASSAAAAAAASGAAARPARRGKVAPAPGASWDYLREMLVVLSKRRGQLKAAVQAFVRAGLAIVADVAPPGTVPGWEDDPALSGAGVAPPPDVRAARVEFFRALGQDAERLKLLDTLREITAGKIFVELERARLTRLLAEVREAEGDVHAAAEVLQSVQVETYGQMAKREKTDYILEQMRLCLAKGDYIKTQILSRKIAQKVLDDPQLHDLKVRFHTLLARYHAHDSSWLDVARAYLEMFHTLPPDEEEQGDSSKVDADGDTAMKEGKKDAADDDDDDDGDKKKKKDAAARVLTPEEEAARDARKELAHLQSAAIFVMLAPHDNEQHDLLARISREKRMAASALCEPYRQALGLLQKTEIAAWAGSAGFEARFWAADGPLRARLRELPFVTGALADANSAEAKLTSALRTRVAEHNIRTVAAYYDQITLARLAKLLDIDAAEAEELVADLVVKGTVWARIDRPGGIVNFRSKTVKAAGTLNAWSDSVTDLLRLVDSSCHLIARESMHLQLD